MDLVDEQHVARLQVGQQRDKVAGALQHRPRCAAQVHFEFVRDHVRERSLAESGRPEDQHMIERSFASPRRFDVDPELLARDRLAKIFGQALWADRRLDEFLVGARDGRNEPVGHWMENRESGVGSLDSVDYRRLACR